jgi:hypothetical protein
MKIFTNSDHFKGFVVAKNEYDENGSNIFKDKFIL